MGEREFHEYDPGWPAAFRQEAVRLRADLGDAARRIEHVGSTAILGMPGKGIIDILVTVDSLEPEEVYEIPLTRLGYIRRPVPERPESPFFTKPATKPRSHNVHIAEAGSRREASMLAFRDYLRARPEEAARYGQAKRELVKEFPNDWPQYSTCKKNIAAELEARAMEWVTER